jgi:hypothetical protein
MKEGLMKIILGHVGSDAGWTEVDTDTGVVTTHPGNRYDDARHAALIVKHATETKDHILQRAAIKAAGEYFGVKSEILDDRGNVLLIFVDR